jgi:hypothetical protein
MVDFIPEALRPRGGRRRKTQKEMADIIGQWARMHNKANATKRAAGMAV